MRYEGIRKAYPHLRGFFGENLPAYIQRCRPFTGLAPFLSVLLGSITYLGYSGMLGVFWVEWKTILYASITMTFAQFFGQVLNQACDPVELDIINKKAYRPIPSGRVSREEAMGVAWLLAIFSIGRGFMINYYFGLFILTLIFFCIIYNSEPFRIKRVLWLNTFWLAVSRGLIPFVAMWSIFGSPYDKTPWLIGSVIFLWVLAWQGVKDINDIAGDLKFNIITPVLYHGVKKFRLIILPISMSSFILLCLLILKGFLMLKWAYLFLLLIPTLIMHYRILSKGVVELVRFENTDLWVAYYLVLAGWYLTSALTWSLL